MIYVFLLFCMLIIPPISSASTLSLVEYNPRNPVIQPHISYSSFSLVDTSYATMEEKVSANSVQSYDFTVTLKMNVDEINIINQESSERISIGQSSWLNYPSLPLLPQHTLQITLPKQASIDTISFTNYSLEKTSSFRLQSTPSLHFWSVNETVLEQHSDSIINTHISSIQQQPLYPGKTHQYTVGCNSTHTRLLIHLYPLQYAWGENQTYEVTEGTLQIRYQLVEQDSAQIITQNNSVQNIIITHPSFLLPAKLLARFHTNQGVTSEVVTTTWIKRNYDPADLPPVQGYPDFNISRKIRKYDDGLARSIVAYLQEQSTNPSLTFITIFGNAIHVPPSFYFGEWYTPVPTDFYYTSPDLDLVPNYRLGRIPVHTIREALKTVQKIIRWEPMEYQMDTVAIAGGIPFSSSFYIGECITTDSVNRGFFDGLRVDTMFTSDNAFEESDIISAMKNEYGMIYIICHGSPTVIAAEPGRITPQDIHRLPRSSNAPIITSIACSSGSFDTFLVRQSTIKRTSFGESILISPGGGIAYIGGSRTNMGNPIMQFHKGRITILKETYMAGLLTYVNEAYGNDALFLGDLTFHAYETFLARNNMDDFWNQYHYFDFVLLGDPALQLPTRMKQEPSFQHPQSSLSEPLHLRHYSDNYDEYDGTIPVYAMDERISFESQTDSPFLNIKHIQTNQFETISTATQATNQGSTQGELSAPSGMMQLIRIITQDHKEDWLYLDTVRPVNAGFTATTPGFGITRWNQISDALEHIQTGETVYVYPGIYKECFSVDFPCRLIGEDKNTTIIDGNAEGTVVTITSDDVSMQGFTIQHCGNHPDDAALFINPQRHFRSDAITLNDLIIQNNLNYGIRIKTPRAIVSPDISVMNSQILYNNRGIFVEHCPDLLFLISNRIHGNKQGIVIEGSSHDSMLMNTFENNYVGLRLSDVKHEIVMMNNFINNTQHCQFSALKKCTIDSNYWDDWWGLRFERFYPFPKIINGIYDSTQRIISQIKIDRHPHTEPIQLSILST